MKPIKERFMQKVQITPTCWLWKAGRASQGRYGTFRIGGKMEQAHRVSWEIFRGTRPPCGFAVCHTCDNGLCVNPEHLFLGTQKDNISDMDAKGRRGTWRHPGEMSPMAKLNAEQVVEIREAWRDDKDYRTQKELAHDYSVSQALISEIVNCKRWGHLETARIEATK